MAPIESLAPLVAIETHPIQYHAPVYRVLQNKFGVPVSVIYGSDFSVKGYLDQEFGSKFAWDMDLVSGYTPIFLSRVTDGGARNVNGVIATGMAAALRKCTPAA